MLSVLQNMEDAGYPPDGVSYALLLEVIMEGGNVESCMDILHHIEHSGNEGNNDGDGSGSGTDENVSKESKLSLSSLMTLKDPSMLRAMRRLCILLGQGQRIPDSHQAQGPGLEANDSDYYEVKPDWDAAAIVARLMVKTMRTSTAHAHAHKSDSDSIELTKATTTDPSVAQEENITTTAIDMDLDSSNTDQTHDTTPTATATTPSLSTTIPPSPSPTIAATKQPILPHGIAIFDEPILPKFFRVRIKNLMRRAKR